MINRTSDPDPDLDPDPNPDRMSHFIRKGNCVLGMMSKQMLWNYSQKEAKLTKDSKVANGCNKHQATKYCAR